MSLLWVDGMLRTTEGVEPGAQPGYHSSLLGAGETAASLPAAECWSLLSSLLPSPTQGTHFQRDLRASASQCCSVLGLKAGAKTPLREQVKRV